MNRAGVDPRLLDELAASATAPPPDLVLDGWHVRANPGLPFRRSSCVVPLPAEDRPTGHDVGRRIDLVEAFYRQRGLAPRFQVSPACAPTDLDTVLAERGYEVEAPVEYHVAIAGRAARAPVPAGITVRAGSIDDGWIESYGRPSDDGDEIARRRIAAYRELLRSLHHPTTVVRADVDGVPAGVGFGVIDRGWMGVFGMATTFAHRRLGVARSVLAALAAAALELGASKLYLQVERDNLAAQALYASAGFEAVSRYHYRTLDATGASAASW